MKPKQVIEQLQEIKQEIQEELDKWGDITKENGADPIPDIIDGQEKGIQAIDHAINCVGAIDQIKWERDIAIQQLNELGYQFGEKIREEDKRPMAIDVEKTHKRIRDCLKADKE